MLDKNKLDGLLVKRQNTDDEDDQLLYERWGSWRISLSSAMVPRRILWC